jgi:hypothetical protein
MSGALDQLVRARVSVPSSVDFASAVGTPVVIDRDTARAYILSTGDVVSEITPANIVSVKDPPFNAKGDGVTDDTAAITSALATGGDVYFPYAPLGYLISSTLTVSSSIRLIFAGAGIDPTPTPSSYLLKKSTMTTAAVIVTAFGATWEGGGVLGQVGNTGDGIQIRGRNFYGKRIKVSGVGNDGFSIGEAGANTNADFWHLDHCNAWSNGRDGFHIESNTTLANTEANGGLMMFCGAVSNTRTGIRNELSNFCTFFMCNGDNNGSYGIIHNAGQELHIGGDFEFNTTGDILNGASSVNTRFYAIPAANVLVDNGTSIYRTHTATDKNIDIEIGAGAGSVRIDAINDARNANVPLEIQASTIKIVGTGVQIGAPTGGSVASGTINAAGGYYLNNSLLLGAKDTTISTGVGSIKMKSANPATNAAWVPITAADGTVYYVPGWTTNNP